MLLVRPAAATPEELAVVLRELFGTHGAQTLVALDRDEIREGMEVPQGDGGSLRTAASYLSSFRSIVQ